MTLSSMSFAEEVKKENPRDVMTLITFEAKLTDGKVYKLTKTLPEKYYGYYLQDQGQWSWQYYIGKDGTAWFQEQTQRTWSGAKKHHFYQWGIYTEDGETLYTFTKTGIMHYGEKIEDPEAMILLYQKKAGDKWYQKHLYHRPISRSGKAGDPGKPEINLANKADRDASL